MAVAGEVLGVCGHWKLELRSSVGYFDTKVAKVAKDLKIFIRFGASASGGRLLRLGMLAGRACEEIGFGARPPPMGYAGF